MNRASFVLCLLLGTLGAAIVAIGVAHDLDRAVDGEAPGFALTVSLSRQRPTPVDQVLDDSPAAATGTIELIVLTNAPAAKLRPTVAPPEPKVPEKSAKRRVDRRNLPKRLAKAAAQQVVGSNGDVVSLAMPSGQRPSAVFELPRVALSFDGRQTLCAFDGGATYGARSQTQLPWQPLRVWRSDAETMTAKLYGLANRFVDGGHVGLTRIASVVRVVGWTDRQIDQGLLAITDHLGLDFLRPQRLPLQSAERRRTDQRE